MSWMVPRGRVHRCWQTSWERSTSWKEPSLVQSKSLRVLSWVLHKKMKVLPGMVHRCWQMGWVRSTS